MIEFFGYQTDLTPEENEEIIKPFLTYKSSEDLNNELNRVSEDIRKFEMAKRGRSSSINSFLFMMGMLFLIFFITEAVQVGIGTAFKNYLLFFVLGLAFITVMIVLMILDKKKRKKAQEKFPETKLNEEYERYVKNRDTYFGIPESNKVIDILASKLGRNKQNEVVMKNPFGIMSNLVIVIYRKDDRLCFCDNYFEYSFKISSIVSFEMVEEKTKLSRWNKRESYNSEKYAKYGLHIQGNYLCSDGYGKMVIKEDDKEYIIRIASYDFDDVNELINKQA